MIKVSIIYSTLLISVGLNGLTNVKSVSSISSENSFVVLSQNNEWKLEKNKEGIQVFTKPTEGSNIKQFKAVTIVNAKLSTIIALLKDTPNGKEWLNDIKSSVKLKEISTTEWYSNLEVAMPWPLDNRDMVLKHTLTQDPITKSVTITLKSFPDFHPKQKGKVRMTKADGQWIVKPVGGGKHEVTYQFAADPSGNVPAVAVNMLIVDGPLITLKNLKDKVKEAKYAEAKLGFIKE